MINGVVQAACQKRDCWQVQHRSASSGTGTPMLHTDGVLVHASFQLKELNLVAAELRLVRNG